MVHPILDSQKKSKKLSKQPNKQTKRLNTQTVLEYIHYKRRLGITWSIQVLFRSQQKAAIFFNNVFRLALIYIQIFINLLVGRAVGA